VKHYLVLILNFFLLTASSTLVWGAAEKAEALEKKIGNLDKLSGLNYFFASWYNDNMWVYALMVTVIMGAVGLLIALVTDVLLKMIGMEVHKIEHHE